MAGNESRQLELAERGFVELLQPGLPRDLEHVEMGRLALDGLLDVPPHFGEDVVRLIERGIDRLGPAS